ncbi:hypothetical protein TNIN_268981 [Trichonephila inaurata madagascariensis]|uniref:BTB domain-containing protein n=1 Tax=Trichonephila inaurata madagascariensis TaxID=2747483 RepID=A0A8X7CCX4_9ARAC|nr:hypothetical protein TNIN_268981 [Trichonephila inaurata madagascariensis]
MNIEKKSKRFYWKIENFGFYFLTQTEPLESPPFQIAGINPDVSFRLALHKQIRERDARVVCFLIASKISRASAIVKIDGVVILKMADETKNFLLQRAAVPNRMESTLLIGTTAWSDAMFSKSDFANYSISVLLNLWRSPLFGSRHCSAVTYVEKQINKHAKTMKAPLPFSRILFYNIAGRSTREFVCKQIESKTDIIAVFFKKKERDTHMKCILSLENHSNVPLKSREFNHICDDNYAKVWYPSDFIPSEVLDDKNRGHFKNNSPLDLKIEVNVKFYEEFGNTREYFSNPHSGTSKKLCHSLKKALERVLRSNPNGCDLIFRCENKDFPVHKSLICCKSPVFSAMFENDMKEKKIGIVEMDDTDSLTLNRFIEHLYLGSVIDSPIDLDSAMALYEIAHKYSILDLVNYSRQFLVLNMDYGKRHEMLRFADLYDDKSLKNLIDYCFYHNHD